MPHRNPLRLFLSTRPAQPMAPQTLTLTGSLSSSAYSKPPCSSPSRQKTNSMQLQFGSRSENSCSSISNLYLISSEPVQKSALQSICISRSGLDMEKLSEREHILLGYKPRDPFANVSNLSHRNSDVDFHDVFGGPPRRSSMHEVRRSSLGDPLSLDSYSSRESGEGTTEPRRPWSSSSEKPVFGEISSPARRRYLGDDFFSDIFQGNDYVCSTPRKLDRDPFSSSPGSRILSPTRPLPPRSELFVGGSSLPAQLSLSMKLAKGIDHPAFSSPTHHALYKNEEGAPDASDFPSSPKAFVPARTIPAQDDQRADAHATYRQSRLSHQISHILDTPLEVTNPASLSMEGQLEKDSSSLQGSNRSSHFHFSIYKWASKGVTLIMPSNSKERSKNERRFSRFPELVLQGADLPSDSDDMPTRTRASKRQIGNMDSKLLKDLITEEKDDVYATKIVEDLLPAEFEFKFLHSDLTEESDICNDTSKEVTMQEAQEPDLKNLHQLSNDKIYRHGNEDITGEVEEAEGLSKGQRNVHDDINVKQQAGRETIMNHVEVTSPRVKGLPVSLEEIMLDSRVKGKVKDFIKIFNQEVSPKPKHAVEAQDRKSMEKDGGKGKVEDQVSTHAAKTDDHGKASTMNKDGTLSDDPIAINQSLKKADRSYSNMSSNSHVTNDSSSERTDTSMPFSGPTPESYGASVGNIEETNCEDLEGCLVEQLPGEQNEHQQTDLHKEQIQVSDAKIREWSKGKEGNIRSLLSTLQYVLWPECGWKPVPLVDIIEGASVKRSYQKALLCLHPDKLQQRGAAMHQKYIAEKVFDILQEAWAHFNSISSF